MAAAGRPDGRRLRDELSRATELLKQAGVAGPRADAEFLAAYLVGVERGRLTLTALPDDFEHRYRDLVDRRARRVPLQHLTGSAAFGPLDLIVGPGVFIPRPETEALLEWVGAQLSGLAGGDQLHIADLCTGSGALAIALADECARRGWRAAVTVVENSAAALDFAARNIERHRRAGVAIELIDADVTAAGLRPDLDGHLDLVVSNPPYIPDGAELEPEVAEHDPHQALFGGPDGMAIIDAVARIAARWLRPAGCLAVEHDDSTSASTVGLLQRTGCFTNIEPHVDLTGRPRFVTAVRNEEPAR